MTSQYSTDEKGVTRKDGKPFDTITNYIWTKYVGGAFDKQEIIGRDLEKKTIQHGQDEGCAYSRRTNTFGAIRVIAYVADDHPKERFWPYEVWREMAAGHPNLMKTTYQETQRDREGKKQ